MTTSASAWQWPLTGHDIESNARSMLLGISTTASLEATKAEAVRIALWAHCRLSRQQSIDEAAVTTRDVLTLARSLVSPLRYDGGTGIEAESSQMRNADDSPDSEAFVGRDMLDLLTEQGDVQPVSRGRWIPSPPRLIPIVGGQFSLLIGCQPAHELPHDAERALQWFGTFRRIASAQLALDTGMLAALLHVSIQPLSQWLGPTPPTPDDLLAWMRSADLSPLAHFHNAAASSEVEVYIPYTDKPQGLRWTPLRHLTRDGRYLLRQRMPWGSARFTFGEVRHGELIAQSGALATQHIRRLCYALDWQERTPTRAEWNRQRGILVLHSEVPSRERKLLSALGLLEVPASSQYLRRWTHLPVASIDRIERMLDELGIVAVVP